MKTRKLRMGMIGGGKNAFIGPIHLAASRLDGLIELVCGALSSQPDAAMASGKELFLPKERIYTHYEDLIRKEADLPSHKRPDFISIVTPNFAHYAPAMAALSKGFHVVIEKPITINLEEALQLKKKLQETGLLLCLTHTYAGYPMVKQARQMVKSNVLGKIKKIHVEYAQGWLSRLSEREGNPQAIWRTDPKKSGKSTCLGDIGTHAAHLAEYITGLSITHMSAALHTLVEGRTLDDDCNVLLKFNNGAAGVLIATQIAAGEENNLVIKVYGENGGLEWRQMEPNSLFIKWLEKPQQIIRAGSNFINQLSTEALHNCRTPAGHPEGFFEAFANIYRNFALSLLTRIDGKQSQSEVFDFPSIDDGIRGMAFIDNVIKSNLAQEKWITHTIPKTTGS